MQNVYCKALEGALKDGCFLHIFICGQRYPVARLEKSNPNAKEYDLVGYAESGQVIDAAFRVARKLMPENAEIPDEDREFECLGIEREVGLRGYTLNLMMLPNRRIMAMIASGSHASCIPIKTVVEDTVEEALKALNFTLLKFDFDKAEFIRFADRQTDPVHEYHRKRAEENK